MNDTARHTIPRRLDDPERWLFWTVDEAAALMGPALPGLAANQFVPGLIAGVGGWLLLRRVKRGGGANIARYALYWFLPGLCQVNWIHSKISVNCRWLLYAISMA